MSELLIEVKYQSRRSLLVCAHAEGQATSLFVPSPATVSPGATVRLKLSFGDASRSFAIAGKVLPIRRHPGAPAGFQLSIASPEERRAWSHVYAFCSRNQEAPKRYAAMIGCRVSSDQLALEGQIRDLSMTGAFVSVKDRKALRVGAPVTIKVKSGMLGLGSTELKGEIIWVGAKDIGGGFGMHFLEAASPVMELMKKHDLR